MDSTNERQVRRQLATKGLSLHKGRATGQGYMVCDAETQAVIGGGSPIAYSLSLEDAADYLTHWDITA